MKTTSTLLKLFVATLAFAAVVCFTANNSKNDSALHQDRNLVVVGCGAPTSAVALVEPSNRKLRGGGRGLVIVPCPPNAGGPGQNGIPFPQGFALDPQFVPAPQVASISLDQLRALFAAFFGN